MPKSPNEPARPWDVIAQEMSRASRGDRILELAEELERALREQAPFDVRKPVKPAGTEMVDAGTEALSRNAQQRKPDTN